MAKKKDDELDLSGIVQKYGGEVLSNTSGVKYFIDTGNLAVNWVCSGKFMGGGLPGGRIVEFQGPSSGGKSLWASNIARGFQSLGGIVIYLDCENAVNPIFMERTSHVDATKLIRFGPKDGIDCLEGVFSKIYNLINAIRAKYPKKPILFIYDSIAVSPSRRELNEVDLPEEYSDAQFKKIVGRKEQPGERAKICNKEFRKLEAIIEKQDVSMLVINQIRQKIGVMYGCFHYDNKIMLSDGTKMKIGKIVNQKLPVEVMSYNIQTGEIEPKKVIDWHINGSLNKDEYFLQIHARGFGGNGRTQIACTPNHMIFVKQDNKIKEVPASSLIIGDKILIAQPYYLNSDQEQVVYGSILGDGSLRRGKKEDSCVQLRIMHGLDQKEYCQWKQEVFGELSSFVEESKKYYRYGFDTIPMHELKHLIFRNKKKCIIPQEVADNLDILGLAVWYLDDGTFAGNYAKWGKGKSTIYCIKFSNKEIMLKTLENKFGLKARISSKGFHFNSENTAKLHALIAPYVHPSMEYKLHPSERGKFNFSIKPVNFKLKPVESEIVDIYEKPKVDDNKKFDLTVEDNHTYIVDGAIVHNSPETGSTAATVLEFYSSCRLRVSAHKKIEHSELKTQIGTNLKIKNIKNRTCNPYQQAEDLQLFFQEGINPLSGLVVALKQAERIELTGKATWKIKEPYACGQDITFKATETKNIMPENVLLSCPALIDAKDEEEVRTYLNIFRNSIDFGSDDTKIKEVDIENPDEENAEE